MAVTDNLFVDNFPLSNFLPRATNSRITFRGKMALLSYKKFCFFFAVG